MKNKHVILGFLLIAFGFQSCIVVQQPSGQVEYRDFSDWKGVPFNDRKISHGYGVERTYNAQFDKLILELPLKAEIIPSRRSRITITAPEEILQRLIVEESRGFLSLRMGEGFTRFHQDDIRLKIYVASLVSLRASTEVIFNQKLIQPHLEIVTTDKVRGDFEVGRMSIETRAIGRFSGGIWSDQLNLLAGDISHLEIYGRAGQVEARAQNSAQIDAKGLNAERAYLTASEKSGLVIGVSQEVQANAKGQGEIVILRSGRPKVDVKEENGGRVIIQ